MPAFTNPFTSKSKAAGRAPTSAGPPSLRPNRIIRRLSSGIVAPGRIVSRAERSGRLSERVDSTVPPYDGQADDKRAEEEREKYEYSFTALVEKFRAIPSRWPWIRSLGYDIDRHFPPGACVATIDRFRSERRPHSLRSLLLLIILLLIVFGALYSLVEYLLLATRASACSVSTVFVPVPYTIIAGMSSASPGLLASPVNESSSIASTTNYTSTSTTIVTSYVTINPAASTSTLPFVFVTNSAGSTEWINGVSPSPGESLVTATTSVFVTQGESVGATRIASTMPEVTSLSMPTYMSTLFSYVSPDLTITSTSTSTHFVTYEVAQIHPIWSFASSRSSFTGIASGGWNVSTSATPQAAPAAMSSLDPQSHTFTSVYYTQASGIQSTSTTTLFLTSTIALRYTTTIVPQSSDPDEGGQITTINSLPVASSSSSGPTSISIVPTNASLRSGGASVNPPSTSELMVGAITATMSPNFSPTVSSSMSKIASTLTPGISPAAMPSSASPSAVQLTTSLWFPSSYGPLSSISSSFTANGLSWIPSAPVQSHTPYNTTATASSAMATTSSGSGTMTWTVSQSTPITSTSVFSPSNSSSVSIISSGHSLTPQIRSTTLVHAVSTGVSTTLTTSRSKDNSTSLNHATHGSIASKSISGNLSSTLSGISMPISAATNASSSSSTVLDSHATTFFTFTSSETSGGPLKVTPANSATLTPASARESSSGPGSSLIGPVRSVSHPKGSTRVLGSATAASTLTSTLRIHHVTSSGSNVTSNPSATASPRYSTLSTSDASAPSPGTTSLRSNRSTRNGPSYSHSRTVTPPKTRSSSITASVSSATTTPSAGCGERGNFVVDFDDLPNFTPNEANDTDITQAPPIFSPYHHLTFSDGYVYAPSPSEPYAPKSPPHLAVFLGNATSVRMRSPSLQHTRPGEIGDGPRESMSAFWFDADSAWFGCDDLGPHPCTLVFSAYSWGASTKSEVLTFQQNATVPPCDKKCHLHEVEFPSSFRGLTGLQIQAFVNKEQRMFFMDNLALRWANNTCAAGLQRQMSP